MYSILVVIMCLTGYVCSFPLLDASEREAKVRESVEKAKEAVGMDVSDGTSWSE